MGMPAVSKRHTDPRYGLTPAQKVAQERRNAALRPFSLAEVAMIGKLGRLLPESELLALLNDRVPQGMPAYSMTQLREELARLGQTKDEASELDWPALRQLLSKARHDGLLAKINETLLLDFAVVFSLNHQQLIALKEVILPGKGDDA